MSNFTSQTSVIIQAPLTKVWEALTKAEMVKKYLFGTSMDTSWKINSPIFFRGELEGKSYEDKGTVLDYKPEKTFSYSYWSAMSGNEDKPENYQIIHFDLETIDANNVKVTITQSNVKSQESTDHSSENWKMILETMKKMLLEEKNQLPRSKLTR